MIKADAKNSQDIEAFINESAELAEARQNGVDLWALWHNFQRTPAERMYRHQIALDTYHKLQHEGTINIKLSPDDSGLTVDHLLQVKKAMDRPRDREAVRQLEAIKKMRGEGSS